MLHVQAYKIYKNVLGPTNLHTQQCANQMKHFTMLCVQQQQQIGAAVKKAQLKTVIQSSTTTKKKKKQKKKKQKQTSPL